MNVWVISPHQLLGRALETLLASLPGVAARGVLPDGQSLPGLAIGRDPSLALWLVSQPMDLETLSGWLSQHPQQKVLCLALSWTPAQARQALRAGAAGCVDAEASPEELALALRQAYRGEVALSPGLQRALILESAVEESPAESSYEALSQREREVLTWVSQGLSNKHIAQRLYLSVRTVENHLSSIYGKLNVSSRTEAAVIALQNGWVELPNP